ncbi:MAG: sugar ABC transporter substrate-binding protein [Oliverpabstia sp.]
MNKKITAILLTTAMVTTMCACGGNSEAASESAATETSTATEGGDGLKMGITYWTASDFFQTIADSIKEEADKDGNTVVVSDAGQDSAKQIQIIEDFIAQDMDVVFLNPVDRDAITPALQELKDAGIKVVNFDSSVSNLDMVDAYVATDNYQAGVLCAEAMLKDFPDGGKIAVLDYPANSACNDREQGFLDTIGDTFEVAATFDASGDVSKGQEITSDILQAHPDLTAIFSINDQAGMGAYAAVSGSGLDIAIYGVDGNPDAKTVINQEGSIYKMTAAQSPIKMGKTCYDTAMKLLNGETLESFQIDVEVFSITAENVGEYLEGWQ